LRRYLLDARPGYVTAGKSGSAFLLNERGGRMRGQGVGRRLRGLIERAGVSKRITPHGLRHAIATHLLAGGMPVERVRDFLGHACLETTQGYTHAKTGKP
jgi:site-specific recombinase XerD